MGLPLPPTAPLAYLPEFPSIGESIGYQINGLIVVMVALCSVWGLLELIGLYFKAADRRVVAQQQAEAAHRAAAAALSPSPSSFPGVSAETIAVIAAAVQVTLGSRYRIHVVKPGEPSVDWAREGRRQIFASHKLR